MKQIPLPLNSHYNSETTTLATCWRAVLQDGTVITATQHDTDLTIGGELYLPIIGYNQTTIQSSSELNPDTVDLKGIVWDHNSPPNSMAFTDVDIESGRWDYAEVEIFEVNYRALDQGKNILRTGTLGEIKTGRSQFNAELRGLMQAFTKITVGLTTKDCSHDLGDARCQVNLVSYTVGGTVASVSENRIINDPGRTEAAEWFTGGRLTFTSGANLGLSIEVMQSSVGQLTFFDVMPFPINPGDTYTVYAGCTKRFTEDCKAKFNNVINFGGFPFLPLDKAYAIGNPYS